MTVETKHTCFVIMPFSKTVQGHDEPYWTEHFERFLKPLIEEIPGIEAVRSRPLRGDILKEIITRLVTAPVVVADITDAKANVYWELGVRQSFKHGTVTIAEEGTSLPFDLGAKGTLFYSNEKIRHGEFSRNCKKAIQDCLEHPERPDSHVLETLSGRGSLFEMFRKDETIRRLDGIISELDWNVSLLSHVVDQSEKNLHFKNPEKMAMTGARMRSPAIELLITTRYLDEDPNFYLKAQLCFDAAVKMNESLVDWLRAENYNDKWIVENAPDLGEKLKGFKRLVASVREKILHVA